MIARPSAAHALRLQVADRRLLLNAQEIGERAECSICLEPRIASYLYACSFFAAHLTALTCAHSGDCGHTVCGECRDRGWANDDDVLPCGECRMDVPKPGEVNYRVQGILGALRPILGEDARENVRMRPLLDVKALQDLAGCTYCSLPLYQATQYVLNVPHGHTLQY